MPFEHIVRRGRMRGAERDHGYRLDRLGLERLRANRSAQRLAVDVLALAAAHRLRIEAIGGRRTRRG